MEAKGLGVGQRLEGDAGGASMPFASSISITTIVDIG
jgi:hypothetical protein